MKELKVGISGVSYLYTYVQSLPTGVLKFAGGSLYTQKSCCFYEYVLFSVKITTLSKYFRKVVFNKEHESLSNATLPDLEIINVS